MSDARAALLDRFRWVDGHADVWRVFRDAEAFRALVHGLADPFRSAGVTAVAGIEARGFLLGGATAIELGVGFVAVRKAGTLFPGQKARELTGPDYRGRATALVVQRESIGPADRVLLVDDWAETGSSALAVARLVAACGGVLAGVAVAVDQLAPEVRRSLPCVRSLVSFGELPPLP